VRGGKNRNLTAAVLQQISCYAAGEGVEHVIPVREKRGRWGKAGAKIDDEQVASRASEKIWEGDVRGAIKVLCSNDSFVAPDGPMLAAMQLLHPPRPADWRSPPTTSMMAPMLATPAAVEVAILSFQGGHLGV